MCQQEKERKTKIDVFRKKCEEQFTKRIKTEVESDAIAQAAIDKSSLREDYQIHTSEAPLDSFIVFPRTPSTTLNT